MSVVAAILAAGSGSRFGGDKLVADLAGRPVWQWSCDTFTAHADVDKVLLVSSPENQELLRSQAHSSAKRAPIEVIVGGASRQESSRIAVEAAAGSDIVLIHDGARPFVSLDHIG